MVEGVPPVDDRRLHPRALRQQLWQAKLGTLLAKLDDVAESGAIEIGQADAPPILAVLRRVENDVPAGRAIGAQRIAGEERRNAEGQPDLDRGGRPHLGKDLPDDLAFRLAHFGMKRKTIIAAHDGSAGKHLGEDWVHLRAW